MAKRADVQMGFRIPSELHQECLESAESMGITLASWIRGAMIMRLKEEKGARTQSDTDVYITRDQLREVLKSELLEIEREKSRSKKE